MATEQNQVTAQDQLLINQFARLYQEQTELKRAIEEIQSNISSFGEAEDEILLLDTNDASSVPLRIGQTFVHFDSDSLTNILGDMKTESEGELAEKKKKLDSIKEEMNELKKILYGKFGDRINLESERDE
ncbi:unnamed protein product [Caenorhabditis bovis]|uniref:Prefoldin subunit 4 n=1 Tax=Caenorhabditis bovis TaxID=2654633 RepID=A0A8S1F837_9PELO|nr:unnamed protein product [Caenorhabditis bovis]